MFSLTDYDYKLPEELIAQKPADQRDGSRLLHVDRKNGKLTHYKFHELSDLLLPADVLVVNNTEVIPGRLLGNKDTGGKAEVLILDYAGGRIKRNENRGFVCKCLVKSSKHPKIGTSIFFDKELKAEILNIEDGIYDLKFLCRDNFEKHIYRIGRVPLPPYIKRGDDPDTFTGDRTSYQTVYASQKGAIAAPTAGLHFSKKILDKIKESGIKVVEITLHVGYGTFLPVREPDIRGHKMHSERYSISKEAAQVINCSKLKGNRVVAVGTTCVRALEYAAKRSGNVENGNGSCDLFIYPGYGFKVVDAMITNFHLPKSTLLMLVSAFGGRKKMLDAYRGAIDKKYRFYSYGDAMFIA